MKKLLIAVLLLVGCATTQSTSNQLRWEEMGSCPNFMTEDQRSSGVVRCRAMCSSYARDMHAYTDDCKCYCQPESKAGRSVPSPAPSAPKNTNPQI